MNARSYRTTIEGRLSERFASAFEGMRVPAGAGRAVLLGEGMDRGHLFGVLDRVRDFGPELVRLEEMSG
ncbi:MAG: hypothetical protein ABR529_14220 [Actinomycetota bacterium]